ncbi:MAG: hypothetical protein HEEMFOPI_01005 [Holosporales bacterium]
MMFVTAIYAGDTLNNSPEKDQKRSNVDAIDEEQSQNLLMKEAQKLSSQIRVSNSQEERHSLKGDLIKTLDKIQNQEFIKPFLFALNISDNSDLVQELSSTFFYIKGPDDYYVVLEKITPENIDAWVEISGRIASKAFLFGDGSDAWIKSQSGTEEEKDRLFEWRKYLRNDLGISYFIKRLETYKYINIRNIDPSSPLLDDMYVAYLTKVDPNVLFPQRAKGEIGTDGWPGNDFDMVMTIQAKHGVQVYSPMGISRSVDGAKRYFQAVKNGTEKKYPISLSTVFHVLSAKIVQHIYPEVDTFMTLPTLHMRLILAQNLNPQLKVNLVESVRLHSLGQAELVPVSMLKKVMIVDEFDKSAPWGKHIEFTDYHNLYRDIKKDDEGKEKLYLPSCHIIKIAIDDLLNLFFPYYGDKI